MPKQQLLFQALSLFSQYLPQLQNYGKLFESTSCVGAQEAEVIGVCYAIKELVKKEDPELAKTLETLVIPFFETIGISRWPRGELTDLGIRVGKKYVKKISLKGASAKEEEAIEGISEADIMDAEAIDTAIEQAS